MRRLRELRSDEREALGAVRGLAMSRGGRMFLAGLLSSGWYGAVPWSKEAATRDWMLGRNSLAAEVAALVGDSLEDEGGFAKFLSLVDDDVRNQTDG